MAMAHFDDVLADFAHQMRQPLSTLEALACYLDLIVSADDLRAHEQLGRMHMEIEQADRILREGMRTLGAYLIPVRSGAVESPPCEPEGVAEELSRPLTNAAMASVTY